MKPIPVIESSIAYSGYLITPTSIKEDPTKKRMKDAQAKIEFLFRPII